MSLSVYYVPLPFGCFMATLDSPSQRVDYRLSTMDITAFRSEQ